MTKEERILRTAYRLHQSGREIHRQSIYLQMLDERCPWASKCSIAQILKNHPDAVRVKGDTICNKQHMPVWEWVGGDDYFEQSSKS